MNVLLFFLAVLIGGAFTGLAYILTSIWLFSAFAGLLGFWITEGLFERAFGYQPAQHWLVRDNLAVH